MTNEGFVMNLRTTELFFRFCNKYKISDYDSRMMLLRKIVAKKKAKYVRDAGEFLKGKKIVGVRKRQ